MHSTRETYEKEANELHSEEALEDPNVQSDTGCIDSNVGQTSSAMLISADDTGRGNCDCAVPSQLIESAPHSLSVGHTLRCTAECCLNRMSPHQPLNDAILEATKEQIGKQIEYIASTVDHAYRKMSYSSLNV
ncbi:hypothetical protein EMCRGX_G010488 [Ephydatia muelleri]